MQYTQRCILFIALTSLLSCIKKDIPDPEHEMLQTTPIKNGMEFQNINGYFIADLSNYHPQTETYFYGFFFSCFSDPPVMLLKNFNHQYNDLVPKTSQNVSVGNVSCSNYQLTAQQTGNTVMRYILPLNGLSFFEKPHWKAEGNSTFPPISQLIERGFPTVLLNYDTLKVNPNKKLTVKFAGVLENCDSIGIGVSDYNNKTYKVAHRSVDSLTFYPEDLIFIKKLNTVVIFFWTNNYSSQTVNNKKFIYELIRREQRILKIDTLL